MRAVTRIRTVPLAGVAAAGVVLGHWAAYRIAVPQAHLRQQVLAESGHGYWILAIKAAVILGLTGAGALFARHVRDGSRGGRSHVDTYTAVVIRLAFLQAIAFTATETVERAVAGAPVAGMFAHHLFVLGLAVQFLTACLGALVVVLLCRTASVVGAALAASFARRPAPMRLRPRPVRVHSSSLLAGMAGPRAPPHS